MTQLYPKALATALFALVVTGCASETEPEDPVVEEMVEALPEITPEEEALIAQGTDASDPSDGTSSEMESGSNAESARQPDPKRSKLIKADPN